MSHWRTRSYWMSRKPYMPDPPLRENVSCDVAIIGGGYTGLWTAIHLKEAEPTMEVVVLESQVVGYGASGRNGGFAMTMLGRNIHDLVRKVGPDRARAAHLAMRDSLREMTDFCAESGIDADITRPGLLTVSNGPEQDVRIQQDLDAAARLDLDDFHEVSGAKCQELVHSERIRCGHFEDDALLVDPAALCRGLRDAAIKRGVRVFERSPVVHFHEEPGHGVLITTPLGKVWADRAVVATNAYAHSVRQLRRFIFTVYAHIIVTEPLTDEQWDRVGWEKRFGIEDKRVMVHFHRPTPDGRILWGGRDAPFSPQGPDPRRDRSATIFQRLDETFRWTFPQLSDVKIASGWAGPVCGTVNCLASTGWLDGHSRIAYSVGYAGHGVGPTHLCGKVLRDLLLGRQSDLLDLPMVTKRPVPLPPDPVRGTVLGASQRILQRCDDAGSDKNPFVRLALKALQ